MNRRSFLRLFGLGPPAAAVAAVLPSRVGYARGGVIRGYHVGESILPYSRLKDGRLAIGAADWDTAAIAADFKAPTEFRQLSECRLMFRAHYGRPPGLYRGYKVCDPR